MDDGSKETVRTIIEKLAALGIPSEKVYVSFSGNKGYHVETFFDAIVETQALRNLYEHVIRDGQLDPKKVEFRPTQHCAIKLPLSVHAKTGNFCCFVNPNSFAPIKDEAYFWGIRQNHVADIQTALSLPEIKEPVRVKPKKAKRKCASKKDDSKQGTELIEKGTRHDTMVRIAVFHRLQGSSQDECKKVLLAWYAAQDQTMIHSSEAEVMRDIEEIICWLFSDHFHPGLKIRQKNSTALSATQILKILDCGNRSERRVYFLLLLRYRMGQMRITANDIRKVVGVSRTTVNTAIKKLLRDHVIA